MTPVPTAQAKRREANAARSPVPKTVPSKPDTPPILRCEGLDVAYGKVQVLFGVDLTVREDEIVALLGTNGAGKSTLLNAISGLIEPANGRICLGDQDITHADAAVAARSGIVHVPGGKGIFPSLTVAEHFKTATWLYQHDEAIEAEGRVERVLVQFPSLRKRWTQLAGDLSGGEQQQLAAGMAFAAQPRLLIFDELSLGLSPRMVEQLLGMVREINAHGCPVLLVEQSLPVALNLATTAYFMEKGRIRFSGPTAGLLGRDDLLRSIFLEGASPGPSTVTAATGRPRPRRSRGTVQERVDARLEARDPVLEGHGLVRRFGGVTAVDNVSLTLRQHQILGLIGPNGAGKTTLMDLLSGHLRAERGTIRLGDVDISRWPAHRRAALGLGRSFQNGRLFPSLSVAENVALGLDRHVSVRSHLAALLGLPAMVASERLVAAGADEILRLLHLESCRDLFVGELSTGTRRVVELAVLLAHEPRVLLLDEPSSGLAQRETEALVPLLQRIRNETGCALLVIEHDTAFITAVSDEIVALDLGKVIAQGPPAVVMSDPRVLAAFLGPADLEGPPCRPCSHGKGSRGSER